MAVIETWQVCNLGQPVKVQYLDGNLFSLDNEGNLFGVEVYNKDGTTAELTGSVSASVIRPDGSTVAVGPGTILYNKAYVMIPQAALAYSGLISIVLKLTSETTVTTLAAVVTNVYPSSTGTPVDPGTVIPSIEDLIEAIEDAVESIPLDYSLLSNNVAQFNNRNLLWDSCDYSTTTTRSITFTWDSTHTICDIDGTIPSGNNALDIIHNYADGMPAGIVAGGTYEFVFYKDTDNSVGYRLYFKDSNGNVTNTTYYESRFITIPADTVGLSVSLFVRNNQTFSHNKIYLAAFQMNDLRQKIIRHQVETICDLPRNVLAQFADHTSPYVNGGITYRWNADFTMLTLNGTAEAGISGNNSYYWFYLYTSGMPNVITAGKTYKVIFNPSIETKISYKVFFLLSDGDVVRKQYYASAYIDVPSNATGMSIGVTVANGTVCSDDTVEIKMETVSDEGAEKESGGGNSSMRMIGWGSSFLVGAIYPDGSLDHICSFENSPWGGIAIGLGIPESNTRFNLLSATGLLAEGSHGNILTNIKATDLSDYDVVLTEINRPDLGTGENQGFPLGDLSSTAGDGTICGAVIDLLAYMKTSNISSTLILVGPPPSSYYPSDSSYSKVFTYVYNNGESIGSTDAMMHQLAAKYHFIYIDFEDWRQSYYYPDLTYNHQNLHPMSDATTRSQGLYMAMQCNYAMSRMRELRKDESVRFAREIGLKNTWVALPVVENEYYRTSDGAVLASATYVRSENLVAVKPGDIISCSVSTICVFYGRNGEFISATTGVTKNTNCTVPSNAYYVGLCTSNSGRAISIYIQEFVFSPDPIEEGTSIPIVSGEYYNTSDGVIKFSDSYVRSKYLYKAEEYMMYVVDNNSTHEYFYDINFNYLGQFTASSSPKRSAPTGTAYIGFASNAGITSLKVTKIDSQKVDHFAYPFSKGCSYTTGYWCNGNGVIASTEDYDLLIMSNPKVGEKYYTNASVSINCVCFNSAGEVLSTGSEYDSLDYVGRIYTIPQGTAYVMWNISKNKTHDSVISIVIDRITKSEKILCIGDSITWLDGRDRSSSQAGNTRYLGYQKQLEAAGYIVNSAGYSGYAYAVTEGYGSIYTQIVTEEYDVSDYDIIILAGGTNDDLYGVTVGTVPQEYDHTFTSSEVQTTAGALGAIISYIRANNTHCKIILCTQLKSESTSRPYSEAVQYANAIRDTAKVDSCFLCDLFQNMNVQPGTGGFDLYFYDTTHPNKAGMERMGKLVLEAVKQC